MSVTINQPTAQTSKVTAVEPVRVGFVMHKMQVAGAEVLVKQIIERLADAIDATVFCLDGVGQLGQKLIDAGTPVVSFDREPGLDWSVARKLAVEVADRRIEVLHAHQYTPFFYSALARLRHGARTKIIFTEHGRHYPDIVSWKRRLTNRFLLQRFSDFTTACCDFSTEALRKVEGFPSATTLRNGVDLTELPARSDQEQRQRLRQTLGMDDHRPYAACIARFHEVKDHSTLVRAWAKVHKTVPEARLLLVGDGPERNKVETLIEQQTASDPQLKNFSSSIEFWGIRGDVAEILRAVDVFTLTSVSEAASLTLLEAMASQCPAVVTDVGGNAEHLRHGIDGFLAPRGDWPQLADHLAELLGDTRLREQFGANARQRVVSEFDLNDVIDRYAQHYCRIARER